jgi:hypothetical protein
MGRFTGLWESPIIVLNRSASILLQSSLFIILQRGLFIPRVDSKRLYTDSDMPLTKDVRILDQQLSFSFTFEGI